MDAIAEHVRDPERRRWSVGVVTFNQPHQQLMETLLEERERQESELEAAMTQAGLEPVFVKNLESVQGDERDVILFSVTYGGNDSGRMAMNFGPLNLAQRAPAGAPTGASGWRGVPGWLRAWPARWHSGDGMGTRRWECQTFGWTWR